MLILFKTGDFICGLPNNPYFTSNGTLKLGYVYKTNAIFYKRYELVFGMKIYTMLFNEDYILLYSLFVENNSKFFKTIDVENTKEYLSYKNFICDIKRIRYDYKTDYYNGTYNNCILDNLDTVPFINFLLSDYIKDNNINLVDLLNKASPFKKFYFDS